MNSAVVLKAIRNTQDLSALENAMQGLCGPSGSVISYEVVFDSNRRTVLCFLETKWPLPESEVRELGAYGFGNMLCFEFPAPARLHGSTRTLSQWARREKQSPPSEQELVALARTQAAWAHRLPGEPIWKVVSGKSAFARLLSSAAP